MGLGEGIDRATRSVLVPAHFHIRCNGSTGVSWHIQDYFILPLVLETDSQWLTCLVLTPLHSWLALFPTSLCFVLHHTTFFQFFMGFTRPFPLSGTTFSRLVQLAIPASTSSPGWGWWSLEELLTYLSHSLAILHSHQSYLVHACNVPVNYWLNVCVPKCVLTA